MAGSIIRRLKPEEEELLGKRQELAAIRATLAERELDLVELRRQLAAFEGRYLRQVGALYAELDEWNARIAELRARHDPSSASKAQAAEAREQARQTYEDAHGQASESHEFAPSPELRRLYREVARRIHPDLATDEADRGRRTRFMAEANRAYAAGDADALRRLLDEYEDGAEAITGEGVGAELIRIIRQISQARARLTAIEHEIAALSEGEIAKLERDSEKATEENRDLLEELAVSVRERIRLAIEAHDLLAKKGKRQ